MDSRYLRFITSVIGVIVAGYLAANIITDFLGPFTAVLRIAAIGLMFIAIVNPRAGMVIVFAELCYIDLFKRLAVYIDGPYFAITLQLLVIPAITIALVTAFSFWKAYQEGGIRLRHFVMLGAIGVLGIVLVFTFRNQGGLMNSLKNAVNIAGYASIIMLIDIHCKTLDDILRLLRQYLWILVPAALYTTYQAIFGFQDFEYYYARTGFTITASDLFSVSPRAFGTFNSISATVIFASAAGFALWQVFYFPRHRIAYLLLALVLIGAMIGARGRGSWVTFAVMLAAYPMLLGWKRLIFSYSAGSIAAFSLFWFSPYLMDHLPDINNAWMEVVKPQNADDYKTYGLLTISDRLRGLKALKENTNYTWTGRLGGKLGLEDYNAGKEYFSHDGINQMMMELGILGLIAVTGFLIFTTLYAHKVILACGDPVAIRLATLCIAFLVPFTVSNLLGGSIIHVTPINFWLFTLVGIVFTVPRISREASPIPPVDTLEPEVAIPAEQPLPA